MTFWTYDIKIWDAVKKSSIKKIQIFQFMILFMIINIPFYVFNHILHSDLKINIKIKETAKIRISNIYYY